MPHQLLTDMSIVKHHIINGFKVATTWQSPNHPAVVVGRLPEKSNFPKNLKKIVINQPELLKIIIKKKITHWKALDEIFPSIPKFQPKNKL